MKSINILIITFIGLLLSVDLLAQGSPIMIIRCRNADEIVVKPSFDQSREQKSMATVCDAFGIPSCPVGESCVGSLTVPSWGICLPACACGPDEYCGFTRVWYEVASGNPLPDGQEPDPDSDLLVEVPTCLPICTDPAECGCPPGLTPFDIEGDGNFVCVILTEVDCFEVDQDFSFERICDGENAGKVTVTVTGPPDTWFTIKDLQNCEFVTADDVAAFNNVNPGSGECAAVLSDASGMAVFCVQVTDTNQAAGILTGDGTIADIEIPVSCFSLGDPCTCDSPYDAATGLYQDALTITGLMPGEMVTLDNASGFLDASGNPIPTPLVVTADAAGSDITIIFYRAEGQVLDITGNGTTRYVSPEPCPFRSECAAIPTLSQWGILSLALLLMMVSIVSLKSRSLIEG